MADEALSPKDVEEINKTWAPVMKDPKSAGILVFNNYFAAHPEYKNLFKKFERISLEDLPNSRQYKAHATAVINAINAFIQNFDDPECLEELLLQNGRQHAHFGVTFHQYTELWDVIIKSLKQACGDLFTNDTEIAWRKLFKIMDKPIKEGLIEEGVDE